MEVSVVGLRSIKAEYHFLSSSIAETSGACISPVMNQISRFL